MNWGLPDGRRRGPLRGPRRVPPPRGRAGPRPARAGHHRDEDLAVRPVRRGEPRARHLVPPTSIGRSSRSGRSAPRSARRWTSWSSCTRSGTCPPRAGSRARSTSSTSSWIEDPVRVTSPDALAEVQRANARRRSPSARRSPGLPAFRDLIARGGAQIVVFDVGWVGGITEARKVAALAEAFERPVAPHDCTGPVVYTAATHLSMHLPNAMIQESVRAFWSGWYARARDGAARDRERDGRRARRARASARRSAPRSSSARMPTSARRALRNPQRREEPMRTFEPGTRCG